MYFEETDENIFESEKNSYYILSLGLDYECTNELAKKFDEKYKITENLKMRSRNIMPDCIAVGRTINLITKNDKDDTTLCKNFEPSLRGLRKLCEHHKIRKIIIPSECIIDSSLTWKRARKRIISAFKDADITIIIYHKVMPPVRKLTQSEIDIILG